MFKIVLRHTKRVVIAVIGSTIIIIGLAFFILPGPGLLVVIVGLAVLATEFAWAQGLLHKARQQYDRVKDKVLDKIEESKQDK